MKQYIDKSALVTEIKNRRDSFYSLSKSCEKGTPAKAGFYAQAQTLEGILSFLDTLEVKYPYEQRLQHDSIKAGIQDYAETYSFNIESQLFPQLTKEQQELWRKEIEQACIGGGEAGVELARDPRYKENLEVKEVDLEKELKEDWLFADKTEVDCLESMCLTEDMFVSLAKKYFELGLKTKKGK